MNRTIIFGAGMYGRDAAAYLRNSEPGSELIFADNDHTLWETVTDTYRVIPPHQIPHMNADRIIIATRAHLAVARQLLDMGCKKFSIALKDAQNVMEINTLDFTDRDTRIDANKIVVFLFGVSGDGGTALWRCVPETIKRRYQVISMPLTVTQTRPDRYPQHYYDLLTARLFLGNGATILRYKSYGQTYIDFWHGLPMKSMQFINMKPWPLSTSYQQTNCDIALSTSGMYNLIVAASMGINLDRFTITGMPRNDLLSSPLSRQNLERLADRSLEGKKVVFFMPTFRGGYEFSGKAQGVPYNHLWMSAFLHNELETGAFFQYLVAHNILFVIKVHPVEEPSLLQQIEEKQYPNVFMLSTRRLKEAGLDSYDVLGSADMLVTDYSSVAFDYLLLNRPLAYMPIDIEQYAQHEGFTLEPYETWTPGEKAYTLLELQNVLYNALYGDDKYAEKRAWLRDLLHRYQDDQSCNRVWAFVDDYMQKNSKEASYT